MNGEYHHVRVDAIVANAEDQPRLLGLDPKHLARLCESYVEDWAPILVEPRRDGRYQLLDGFHRLDEARRRKLDTILARVVQNATWDAGIIANLGNGLPLTLADRKWYAQMIHEQHPEYSLRQIARACGLSPTTVQVTLQTPSVHSGRGGESTPGGEQAGTTSQPPLPSYVRQAVRLLLRATRSGEGYPAFGIGPASYGARARDALNALDADDAARVARELVQVAEGLRWAAQPWVPTKAQKR